MQRIAGTALLATVLLACTTAGPTPTAQLTPSTSPSTSIAPTITPGPSPTTPGPSPTASAAPSGSPSARACDYVPGNPVAALPPPVEEPEPTSQPELPDPTAVPAATLEEQLEVFDAMAELVPRQYLHPELNGLDWPALVAEHRPIVERGHTEEGLEAILNGMIAQLGDDHSYVLSATSAREVREQLAGEANYVGVGIYVQPLADAARAVILAVFPNSPAERAGLRGHDSIVAVDGQPIIEPDGSIAIQRIRGLPETDVTLTIERPGEPARDVTMTREGIGGGLPIRACLVAGTGVAYVLVPCLCDLTIPTQIREALRDLSEETKLTGVVLDNRINGGGDERALTSILELFTQGSVGSFEGIFGSRELELEANGVAGSQDLPVVVLVGDGTASYGEVMSGILQASDESLVIGTTTDGNVETLRGYNLGHEWELWLAGEAFQSADADYGPWEETGIIPDLEVPTRWDLFTEANDPALAAAVDALTD